MAHVDPVLRARIEDLAKRNDRSLSSEVRRALRAHVLHHELGSESRA